MRKQSATADVGTQRVMDGKSLDARPSAGELLGFENPWQTAAMPHGARRTLPSGAKIRAVTPPYLIATKLAAFGSRGRGDHLGSRDLEDVTAMSHRILMVLSGIMRHVKVDLENVFWVAFAGRDGRPDLAHDVRVGVLEGVHRTPAP